MSEKVTKRLRRFSRLIAIKAGDPDRSVHLFKLLMKRRMAGKGLTKKVISESIEQIFNAKVLNNFRNEGGAGNKLNNN